MKVLVVSLPPQAFLRLIKEEKKPALPMKVLVVSLRPQTFKEDVLFKCLGPQRHHENLHRKPITSTGEG